jgi:uncharacterized linocin/CFP29 family protein
MDILRQSLAPISNAAWEEINETAREAISTQLSGRKFIDVDGPHGWDFTAVSNGRLKILKNTPKDAVRFGNYNVQPLVESRISFKLNIWELDNISRGAEDADLEPLEIAARKIAEFEEKAVFEGAKDAGITGLKGASEHEAIPFPEKPEGILNMVAKGIGEFTKASVQGPYTMILGTEKWEELMSYVKGYPLFSHIERMMGGKIIISPNISEGFLVSSRGGDFKLTIGQDISIGYEKHDDKEVQLYLTESFTFRVIEPKAVIVLK